MTLDELLQLLLIAADDSGRAFRHRDLAEWPEDGLEVFSQLGILRRGSGGLMAECDNCTEPHLERVIMHDDDPSRMFISCPDAMRVEVTPEMCQCWEVDPGGLADQLNRVLGLSGKAKEVIPSRLWRLGRVLHDGKTREVLLAMGLHLQDAGSIALQVGPKGRSIVLVPSIVPDDRIWPDVVPAVIALDQISSVEDGQFIINGHVFMDMIAEADECKDRQSILPVDPAIKKEVAGRMVTRAIEVREMDKLCIQARMSSSSYDKAAEILTNQLGRQVTRDRVYRAFKRDGGYETVMASNPRKGD